MAVGNWEKAKASVEDPELFTEGNGRLISPEISMLWKVRVQLSVGCGQGQDCQDWAMQVLHFTESWGSVQNMHPQ